MDKEPINKYDSTSLNYNWEPIIFYLKYVEKEDPEKSKGHVYAMHVLRNVLLSKKEYPNLRDAELKELGEYNRVIKEANNAFDALIKGLSEDREYFLGCSIDIYKETYNSRLESYLEKNKRKYEISFIRLEIAQGKKTRVHHSSYPHVLEDFNNNLENRRAYLIQRSRVLGYDIEKESEQIYWEEERIFRDHDYQLAKQRVSELRERININNLGTKIDYYEALDVAWKSLQTIKQVLSEDREYFLGCSIDIYKETYNSRLESYLETYTDNSEHNFVENELSQHDRVNEYLAPPYEIEGLNRSLEARKEFLIQRAKELGYKVFYDEDKETFISTKLNNAEGVKAENETQSIKQTPQPDKEKSLNDLITHKKSKEVVEGIKIQYKGIKGKKLKLLLITLQELNLFLLEGSASAFHNACKAEFDWNIASYQAMNGYSKNDHVDIEELNRMRDFIKSIISQ